MAEKQAGNRTTARPDHAAKRVFSVPPGAPFLRTLAKALVSGELIDGFCPQDDPFALARATIYLPTRRSVRALGDEFASAMGKNAVLLPVIRTFGDSDDDELELVVDPAFFATEASSLPDAIAPQERKMQLAMLVRRWTDAISRESRNLFGDEDIVVPSTTAEAVRMAGDLARLFDQIETEEIAWAAISRLADSEADEEGRPAAWAQWWNLTLHFLKIVSEHWPAILKQRGALDPSERRRALLDMRTQAYLQHGSQGPVIAAGSTGSIPATARLIAAISTLHNGAVVLPGLEFRGHDGSKSEIFGLSGIDRDAGDQQALTTHPQFSLACLIRDIGVTPDLIKELGNTSPGIQERRRLISAAMLPAPLTGGWAGLRPFEDAATANIAIIEAHDEREEALSIAIAMREALEEPGKTAALTTPDRNLARRVAAELGRFNILVDDSGGLPLTATPSFGFAMLVLHAAFGKPNAVTTASIAKHPFVTGEPGSRACDLARRFEVAVLRDAISIPRPGGLAAAVERARVRSMRVRLPTPVRDISDEVWGEIECFAGDIDRAFTPLASLNRLERLSIADAADALRQTLDLFAASTNRNEDAAATHGLQELRDFLAGFSDTGNASLTIRPAELAEIVEALCEDITVRPTGASHPRLSIWGPLEARLQTVNLMVVGGLNEGTWPSPGKNDPFLNRPMKACLGMSLPERRIGLAAHDFQQLSGHAEIIYSRAMRQDNAPTIASRWLQRLVTVTGAEAALKMRNRGKRYLHLAKSVDMPAPEEREHETPIGRPCPRPPVALRPTRLSITEIETWIRDPYAIFARHVLELRPLPPLVRIADPMLKGSIYHRILERYVSSDGMEGEPMERMDRLCEMAFVEYGVTPDVAGVWRKRFMAIAQLFVDWEESRQASVQESHCELAGCHVFPETGFEIRGRADRIDVMANGTLEILDYKTGLNPSLKQARTLSPQLALEAKMAELGAFSLPPELVAGNAAYVRLRAGDKLRVDWICGGNKPLPLADLADDAWSRLVAMIDAFSDRGQGYQSRRAPFLEGDVTGDYDHLARTREWMVRSEDAGDGDG